MRFGLWRFLLLVVLAAVILGFYGRQWLNPYGCTAGIPRVTGKGSRYDQTVWTIGGRLHYCVLRPVFIDVDSWSTGFGKSNGEGVDLTESGIFLDGEQVPMTARVFVYTVDGKMRPIPLAEEELAQVLDFGSAVWLKKIEPVIDQDYQRGVEYRREKLQRDLLSR